jgi:hypothetical protein
MQGVAPRSQSLLSWAKRPISPVAAAPRTPASSQASWVAASGQVRPGIGQPLGTIHCPVPRVVTSSTWTEPSA